jgi:hypothetical protein
LYLGKSSTRKPKNYPNVTNARIMDMQLSTVDYNKDASNVWITTSLVNVLKLKVKIFLYVATIRWSIQLIVTNVNFLLIIKLK